ncbi:MAG: ORF6N domain-containing protein [Candidatus Saganbacteria bacterium]|nr:ORF6N domain-containing protein [Candidatus Saganbacteria bacterium]
MSEIVPIEIIEKRIYVLRGQKVMLDRDLAELYGVSTKNLNKALKRNIGRFPLDFMFRLNEIEVKNLRFQNGTSSWGGRRYLPFAFTELGVAMLSSILSSERAVHVNISIMRAFVRLRQVISTHKELANKVKQLERKGYKHDGEIQAIFEAIQLMMKPPEKPRKRIGFVADEKEDRS